MFGKRAVYIVSGLRIAKTSFKVTKEVESKFKAEIAGSGPPAAGIVPVEVGGSVSHHYENKIIDSYKTAPAIVFAYRLHVIRYRRRGVETELFKSKSAFMTGNGGLEEEDPLMVLDATKEELDQDLGEENDYTESVVGEGDVCISF